MAYDKHTWRSKEKITAAKLNNMEDGIESASSGSGAGAIIIGPNDVTECLDVDGHTAKIDTVPVWGVQGLDDIIAGVNAGAGFYITNEEDGVVTREIGASVRYYTYMTGSFSTEIVECETPNTTMLFAEEGTVFPGDK